MKGKEQGTEKKQLRKAESFGCFMNRHADKVLAAVICLALMGATVFAEDPPATTVDTLWTTISGLIETWVTRLGGVVMLVGGVMFGLGWKSDDAEQKSRGIQTIIAGGIVAAVAALTSTFFGI